MRIDIAGGELRFDDGYLQHVTCYDPVELTSRVREWNWTVTVIERGGFRADCTAIPLGELLVMRLSFNRALLHRLEAPRGCASLVLVGGGASAVFVGGRRIGEREALIMRSGSSLEMVSRGECTVTIVSVSESAGRFMAPLIDLDGTLIHRGVEILGCDLGWKTTLLASVDSGSLHVSPIREAFCDLVLALLEHLRGQPRNVIEPRKSARRRIGVERAREYIASHLVDPIRLSDLCHHTHLQARSLEYGFREILGLSPVSYVKMLRLGEAHRRLLSCACNGRSISEVALDSGFWHLSQFAVDYKKLFMESPSATRRRRSAAAPYFGAPAAVLTADPGNLLNTCVTTESIAGCGFSKALSRIWPTATPSQRS